jgi:hypothetical protein
MATSFSGWPTWELFQQTQTIVAIWLDKLTCGQDDLRSILTSASKQYPRSRKMESIRLFWPFSRAFSRAVTVKQNIDGTRFTFRLSSIIPFV